MHPVTDSRKQWSPRFLLINFRRISQAVVLLLCMALTACYEDGDYAALSLWGVVADHENRLTALKEWQEQANSDIAALQQLVNATTADYIIGVTPVMQGGEQVGYTITFLHAAPIRRTLSWQRAN